jgi:hypothetical protein
MGNMTHRDFNQQGNRPAIWVGLLLCCILLPVMSLAQSTPAAAPDSAAIAAVDTTAAPRSALADLLKDPEALAALKAAQPEPSLITKWDISPQSKIRAEIRKILYQVDVSNELELRDKSTVTQNLSTSLDDYRQQDKTVEKRDGSLIYRSSKTRTTSGTINMMRNWNEDRVTNSSGAVNTNKRDFQSAVANVQKTGMNLKGIEFLATGAGSIADQKSEAQGQRNDFSEAALNGMLHSTYAFTEGVSLQAHYGRINKSGDKTLGERTDPSTATGDTVEVTALYEKGRLSGTFQVLRSAYTDEYLDWNRTSNGIVDTNDVEEKIVQEIETDDVLKLEWVNSFPLSIFNISTSLKREMSENDYNLSGVGKKDKLSDTGRLSIGFRPTVRDTIHVNYNYGWKWDDQTYQGATEARGRQESKSQDVKLDWQHQLFLNTLVNTTFKTGLSQSTAENAFNLNDRDRIETTFGTRMDTNWGRGRKVNLAFNYQSFEDIQLRKERSANNSIKETFEISPGYRMPLVSFLTIDQSLSVWIQYTDYVYSDLEAANKTDKYNKRANMNTKFTFKPNSRLTLVVRHDLNFKRTSNKSGTTAAGGDFYQRDSDQNISKINFMMTYNANQWLKLEATTYQQRDLKETFGGNARETERFSGDVAVGGSINRKFGQDGTLKVAVLKYYAHGDNVQPTAQEYWDADIQFSWRF